jgi:hypothetical protein
MSRNSKYEQVVIEVLTNLGGGPVSCKTLVETIVDKGLLENRKYLYHNVLNRVRRSALFDTSVRGMVSLSPQPVIEAPAAEVPVAPPVLSADENLAAEPAVAKNSGW